MPLGLATYPMKRTPPDPRRHRLLQCLLCGLAITVGGPVLSASSLRNTAIVRANQRTQENIPLYKEALDLWPILTRELDFNLMFYNCGNLNLAHSDAAMKSFRMNVATAQFHGSATVFSGSETCFM